MIPSFKNPPSPSSLLRTCGKIGLLTAALSGLAFTASPVFADVSVNLQLEGPPPPPRHEVIIERERPSPDHVWVEGYWGGSPGHYTWVAGRWDRPPHGHPHGRWVAPHWENRGGHYVQIKGEWRD